MAQRKDPRRKIIDAALKLAADRPWQDVHLNDVAAKAKVSLGEMRELFESRTAILVAFIATLDRETLDSPEDNGQDADARDRLFDVIMRRLELMEPHKQAVRNIVTTVRSDPVAWPDLARAALGSQRWMLVGAGLDPSGLRGEARIRGLALVYWSVLKTWLDDEDPGLARTMSVLDRQLRRGETLLRRTNGPVMLLCGLGALARAAVCRASRPPTNAATAE